MKLPGRMLNNIPFVLAQVDKLIQTKVDQELSDLGLTRSQWLLLSMLHFVNGCNQTDMADLLDIGKGALGKLVQKLEAKGWIYRQTSPSDARSMNIFIAPNAEASVKVLVEMLFEYTSNIQRNFTKAELDTLRSLLSKMQSSVEIVKQTKRWNEMKGELVREMRGFITQV